MATPIQNPSAGSNFAETFDRFMNDLDVAIASGDFTGFGLGSEPLVVGHNDGSTVLQNSTVLHDSTGLHGITTHFFLDYLLTHAQALCRPRRSTPFLKVGYESTDQTVMNPSVC